MTQQQIHTPQGWQPQTEQHSMPVSLILLWILGGAALVLGVAMTAQMAGTAVLAGAACIAGGLVCLGLAAAVSAISTTIRRNR